MSDPKSGKHLEHGDLEYAAFRFVTMAKRAMMFGDCEMSDSEIAMLRAVARNFVAAESQGKTIADMSKTIEKLEHELQELRREVSCRNCCLPTIHPNDCEGCE